MSRSVQTCLLFIISIFSAASFSWDKATVDRLFDRSDEVFAALEGDPDHKICVNDLQSFVNSLKHDKKWALRVMDAWAKEPPGLASSVDTSFGSFDQCSEGVDFKTCLVRAENSLNYSYTLNVCVPRSCSPETTLLVFGTFFRNLEVGMSEVVNCSDPDSSKLGSLQLACLILLLGLVVVAALGTTLYHFGVQKDLFEHFSVFRNVNKLLEQTTDPHPMSCLNGLQVLATFWITLLDCHLAFELFYKLANPDFLDAYNKSLYRSLVYGGEYTIDIMYLIFGLQLTFKFLQDRREEKEFSIFKHVLGRYVKLIPTFGVTMLAFLALEPFFNDSPVDPNYLETYAGECRRYWWSALLLVQTYVNPQEVCIFSSFFISTEFHLFVFSPLLLFPLAYYGKWALPILALVSLVSISYLFSAISIEGYHFISANTFEYLSKYYNPAHVRVTAWLVGMFVGYLLFSTENKKVSIGRCLRVSLWILAGAAFAGSFYIPYLNFSLETTNRLEFAFFVPLQRLAWSLAFAWVIFACVKGYGGPLNWMLSFPLFQPLSRLAYGLYILHVPLTVLLAASPKTLVYATHYVMVHHYLGILVLSLLLTVPIVVLIDMPIDGLQRWIRSFCVTKTKL